MTKQAILFGSIGTVVETSEMQRQAFNQAFEEAGLDWAWDPNEYKELLKSSGGEQRIKAYGERKGQHVDAAALHARKTAIFDKTMVERGLPLRTGVAEVVQSAKEDGVKLAFVTTTSRANIDAIFAALADTLSPDDFAFISDVSAVNAPKPSPDIYKFALNALSLDAADCVAIEDTGVSAEAPVAAGVETVGFAGKYAEHDDFDAVVRMTDALHYKDLIGAS